MVAHVKFFNFPSFGKNGQMPVGDIKSLPRLRSRLRLRFRPRLRLRPRLRPKPSSWWTRKIADSA